MTASIATVSLALVAAALAAGCAADPQSAASGRDEPKASPEYRTGSNIPVREPRHTSDEQKARTATPAEAPRGTEPAKTN